MHLRTYTDPRDYLNDCGGFLMEHEAENCLILSLALRFALRSDALPPDTYMASVTGDEGTVAAAAMPPAFRLVLTSAPDTALRLLCNDLLARGLTPSGVIGPKQEAAIFAELWRKAASAAVSLNRAERIYQLDRVIPPQDVRGSMRPATGDDFPMAVEWTMAFDADTGMNDTRAANEKTVEHFIAEGRLFIWEDERPVAMAGWLGPTPGGVRIALVYTPPQHRGNGYASACVAALSQHLLDAGRQYCFLFTDLANPTSNSIYRKIGYRPVIDVDAYDFNR